MTGHTEEEAARVPPIEGRQVGRLCPECDGTGWGPSPSAPSARRGAVPGLRRLRRDREGAVSLLRARASIERSGKEPDHD